MVTTTEIALLLLVLVLLFGADTVIKTIKPLIVDAVVGVIIPHSGQGRRPRRRGHPIVVLI